MISRFEKILSKYRHLLLGNYREHVLSTTICDEIGKLEKLKRKKVIKILDFGSGFNHNILINKIIKKLTHKYKNTKFLAYCYDFYTKEELKIINTNANIKFLNINSLSNNKVNKFNFCLVIDVLHHIGLHNNRKIFEIIKKLRKRSKFLIIKDHFQYGFFSNLALIIMDFVGNYYHNIKIPSTYFTIKTFENFLSKMNLEELKRIDNKKYYKWYCFYFNSSKLQFISIVK